MDSTELLHYKDAVLDSLAQHANVAQFVSFSPRGEQRHARVAGYEPNHRFPTNQDAVSVLLDRSSDSLVNIRSFDPTRPKSREFLYGLKSADEVLDGVRRLGESGLHTIVNETIDVHDGGVSGVLLGDAVEFAPDDTPRCVERPGTAAFPRELGAALLEVIYGFKPSFNFGHEYRVEFSLHPLRRGFRREHTVIWETELVEHAEATVAVSWPNRFSQFIGDKAFGLLVAHLLDLPVPETTVLSRSIAPFRFGRPTGSSEIWIRTCPRVQVPGKFTTHRGWLDPFKLIAAEDPTGSYLSSVLAQVGVDAVYSGAAIASDSNLGFKPSLTIEGTQGFGDEFMVGRKKRTLLPRHVNEMVEQLYSKASAVLGPVRFEWVTDTQRAWIVQFHTGASPSHGRVIFPGNPQTYRRFSVEDGLEALRELIDLAVASGEGIVLVGDVGVTSHFGDVLRRARVPSYIEPTESRRVTV